MRTSMRCGLSPGQNIFIAYDGNAQKTRGVKWLRQAVRRETLPRPPLSAKTVQEPSAGQLIAWADKTFRERLSS